MDVFKYINALNLNITLTDWDFHIGPLTLTDWDIHISPVTLTDWDFHIGPVSCQQCKADHKIQLWFRAYHR